ASRRRAIARRAGRRLPAAARAAAYADARAVERGPRATDPRATEPGATEPGATDQGPRIRMAAAAIDRQTLQAPPTSVSPAEGFGPPLEPLPEAAGQPVGQSPAAGWPTLDHLPTLEQLAPVFDVTTNGRAMLSAAGGLALAVLGLRTLFGGRRRTAVSARDTFDED
ncbi:MAG: hypothetical protein ACKOK8_03185, partial [Planctomycetia bacterium]